MTPLVKTVKKLFAIYFLLTLFFLSLFFFWPDNKLHLIICDVGQGDAILLQKRFIQVLIDGGPNKKVLECLSDNMPFWDKEIELVVNTHQEKDHIAGLVSVIERYSVDRIVINSLTSDTEVFRQFHQLVLEKGIPVYSPEKEDKIMIDELALQVLWPETKLGDLALWEKKLAPETYEQTSQVLGAFGDNMNESSLVLHLRYGKFDALLTGDIGSQTESQIEVPQGIEVLKVPHHGSKYSSSEAFLQQVRPVLAVISVGKNPWSHPTEEVLEKLKNLGIKILRTDKDGEVEITTNGQTWQVFKNP